MSSRVFWCAIVFVCFCGSAHAGFVEICKVSDPPDSLSNPFYFFTIAGQPGLGEILVPADACTAPPPDAISLPDGYYTITEVPDPTSVLESVSTFPDYALISVDLQNHSATVLSAGDTDPTQELTVFFENTPVPEPGMGWVVGLGLTVWALRRNLAKRPSYAAFRNATSSVVGRALHSRYIPFAGKL
jgi:hypothetical protein